MAEVEQHCRETPGFLPVDQWEAKMDSRLAPKA